MVCPRVEIRVGLGEGTGRRGRRGNCALDVKQTNKQINLFYKQIK